MLADPPPVFPKRRAGRRSPIQEAEDASFKSRLADWIENRWRETGLAFGGRGWAYVAEGEGIITKGEFKKFETMVADLRKDGLLDPDAVADDEARAADHVEYVDDDDPDAYAAEALDRANDWLDRYSPISFFEGLDVYLQCQVEKADLKLLFGPTCARYCTPLVNARGSNDINLRRRILQRFAKHHLAGRRCILLYFGDHDPAGLSIGEVVKSNLMDLAAMQGIAIDPSVVEVVHFGLNRDQIDQLGLTWIDGLETGSGRDLADPKHPDHFKRYVQNYIADHGLRKVEANALARDPEAARALIESVINRYIPSHWPALHQSRLAPHRQAARRAFAELIGSTP